jgi:hypothetical protein
MKQMMRLPFDSSGSFAASRNATLGLLSIGLTLTLSANVPADDDAPVETPCPGVTAGDQSDASKENYYPRYVCPYEYFGLISGVHWYDGHKGYLGNDCDGSLYEVPSESLVQVGCNGNDCINELEYQLYAESAIEESPQRRYCKDTADRDPFIRANADLTVTEVGIVTVRENTTDRPFLFRLLEVSGRGRTRRVGMEIDRGTTGATAYWHSDGASNRRKYVHEVNHNSQKYIVTTVREVTW